jgi:hypothetical protein
LTDGDGALVLQDDGNLVFYVAGRVCWASGTYTGAFDPVRTPVALILQEDGNLVLYTYYGQAVWSTGTRAGLPSGTLLGFPHPAAYAGIDSQGGVHNFWINTREPSNTPGLDTYVGHNIGGCL